MVKHSILILLSFMVGSALSGCKWDGSPQTLVQTTNNEIKPNVQKMEQYSKQLMNEINSTTPQMWNYKAKAMSNQAMSKIESEATQAYSQGSVLIREGFSEQSLKNKLHKAESNIQNLKDSIKQ